MAGFCQSSSNFIKQIHSLYGAKTKSKQDGKGFGINKHVLHGSMVDQLAQPVTIVLGIESEMQTKLAFAVK